jgi:tetratricopeptide (TPR) repeat protein
MSESPFTPKIDRVRTNSPSTHSSDLEEVAESTVAHVPTAVEYWLQLVSRYCLVALLALLPLFFVPKSLVPVTFDKSLLALVLLGISVGATMLSWLGKNKTKTVFPISLVMFWLVVMVAYVSAYASGDPGSALRGNYLEQTSAVFLLLIALSMTAPLVFQGAAKATLAGIGLFGVAGVVLLLHSLLRFVLGPGFLDFGQLSSVSVSLIGGLNNLAVFAGLIIVFGVVTLLLFPIRKWMQLIVVGSLVVALLLLSAINFTMVWIILGFFSFLMLLYLVARKTLFGEGSSPAVKVNTASPIMFGLVSAVFVFSVAFVVAGNFFGQLTNSVMPINYLEVRPSMEATIDIAKQVYQEDLFLGVGPNRFSDAWRLYKDPLINETIYWDTDFIYGYGLVPTMFITTGLLGGIGMVVFHLFFLFLGYKLFVRNTRHDPYWYYLGMVSFASAVFLWSVSYFYVPNSALLLLAAIFTGLTFASARALAPAMVRVVPLALNQQRGFMLMAIVVILLGSGVFSSIAVSKQYVAQAIFRNAEVNANTQQSYIEAAQRAYGLYPSSLFAIARAQGHVTELNRLLQIPEPNEQNQREFLSTTELAIQAAEDAQKADDTDPDVYVVLASIYNVLALAPVDGARDRAEKAITDAIELDPQNPGYHLIVAQMAVQANDFTTARTEIDTALSLKRNFTDALFLSSQLDIREGNTQSAVETVRSVISLDPRNPTRYFQLGVLLAATNDTRGAQTAFMRAVELDPHYANARYLLALEYAKEGRDDAALEQLQIVQQTNPENRELLSIIERLESGEPLDLPETDFPSTELSAPMVDPEGATETEQMPSDDTGTDLLSPVNTVSDESQPPVPQVEQEALVPEEAIDTVDNPANIPARNPESSLVE